MNAGHLGRRLRPLRSGVLRRRCRDGAITPGACGRRWPPRRPHTAAACIAAACIAAACIAAACIAAARAVAVAQAARIAPARIAPARIAPRAPQAPRCRLARRGFHPRNEGRKIPMLVEVQVRVA
ncbi:hypothetical protein WMF26_23170 [Sorangium sp. So ce185]|uniref:hypothetical protein n=1 Tax=Sorangium sp. So ce185 TaxID=3133287 RepID=UPI003F5DC3E3